MRPLRRVSLVSSIYTKSKSQNKFCTLSMFLMFKLQSSLLTGYFTLPVTCLIGPEPSRLLRPVDPVFVDTLKAHMKRNPSRDVTLIVGLVQLADGEEFQEDRKESYLYKTLGSNNSRVAMQQLLEEEDFRFRTRLVSVYCHLSDNQSLRLASKHNLATSVHHDITTSDKVRSWELYFLVNGTAKCLLDYAKNECIPFSMPVV